MPRAFVPCLYREEEMQDIVSQTWHRRLEVTEIFTMADCLTREPYETITRDSHGYLAGLQVTPAERFLARLFADGSHPIDSATALTRGALFERFYAAMAALE